MTTQTYSPNISPPPLKRNEGNGKVLKVFALAIFASLCLLLGGVLFAFVAKPTYQVAQMSSFSVEPVSRAVMLQVEKQVRAKFLAGEWRFADIDQQNGIVQVYIQIPQQLAFSGDVYDNYVRQSVCPAPSDSIWQKIPTNQLSINLYSALKSQSVTTLCG
jgi:hypothetical protein